MAFRAANKLQAGNAAGSRPLPLMQIAGKASRTLGELNADLRAGGFGGSAQGLGRELYASFTATIVATKGSDAESMAWAIGRALVLDLDRAGFRRGASILLGGLIEFGTSHADPKILERLRKTEEELRRKPGWRWRSSSSSSSSPEPRRAAPPESPPANRAEAKAQPPRQPAAAAPAATPRPPAAEPPPEVPLILTKEAPPEAAPETPPETPRQSAAPKQPEPARPQGVADPSAQAARAPRPERPEQVESREPGEAPAAAPAEAAAEPPEMLDLFAGLPEQQPRIVEPQAPVLPEAAAPTAEPHRHEPPAPAEAAPAREEPAAEMPAGEAAAEPPETFDPLTGLSQRSEADEPAPSTPEVDAAADQAAAGEVPEPEELAAPAAAEPPAEMPAPVDVSPETPEMEVAAGEPELDGGQEPDAAAAVEEPPAEIPAEATAEPPPAADSPAELSARRSEPDEPAPSTPPVADVTAGEPEEIAPAPPAMGEPPEAMPDEAAAGPEAVDPYAPLWEPPAEPDELPASIPPLPQAAVPERAPAEPVPEEPAPEGAISEGAPSEDPGFDGPVPGGPAPGGPSEERPIFAGAAEPDPFVAPEPQTEADEAAEFGPADLATEAPEEIPSPPGAPPGAQAQPAAAFQEAPQETAPAAPPAEARHAPKSREAVADAPAQPAPRKRRRGFRIPAGIRFDPAPRHDKPHDERPADGEKAEPAVPPIGRREPRLSARLLGDPDLGPDPRFEAGERPVPPPDPAARRRRSRAVSGFATGATAALLAVLAYLLVAQDGRLLRHFQSTVPGVASLPSVEPTTHAVASNASTANASTANPPPANPSSTNPPAGSPAASPPAASPSAVSAATAEASPSNAPAAGSAATGVPANNRPFVAVPDVTASTMTASTGAAPTGSAPGAAPPPAPTTAAPPTAGEPTEKLPPQGMGELLSEEEVRYCVFQGRRLGYLRNQVIGDEAIQRFNTLVADFNSRCRNFRYDNNALQIATEQAGALETQLKADAANILASWAPEAATSPTLIAGSPLIDLQSREGAAAVQARLKELGYYQRTVDGRWGPRSAAALASFRQDKGLGPNGVWDISTQLALLGQ
jgi:Putative peptidoglycan binding domain